MDLKKSSNIVFVSIFILCVTCGGVAFLFAQQEIVEGKLVDSGYTVKSSATFVDGDASGTVGQLDYFFLVIEVNGETSSYRVKPETFLKAAN